MLNGTNLKTWLNVIDFTQGTISIIKKNAVWKSRFADLPDYQLFLYFKCYFEKYLISFMLWMNWISMIKKGKKMKRNLPTFQAVKL